MFQGSHLPFNMRNLETMVDSFLRPLEEGGSEGEHRRHGHRGKHHRGPGPHHGREHGHHGHHERSKHCKYGPGWQRSVAQLDIISGPNEYKAYVDVPGVALGDMEVEIVSGTLIVSGERKLATGSESQALRSERQGGAFKREWELPEDAFIDGISARLANGELVISIPRQAQGEQRLKVPIIYGGPSPPVAPTPSAATATTQTQPIPTFGPASTPGFGRASAPFGLFGAALQAPPQARAPPSARAFATASASAGRSNEVHVDINLSHADWRDPSLSEAALQERVMDPIIAAVAAARAANPRVYEDAPADREEEDAAADIEEDLVEVPEEAAHVEGAAGPTATPAPTEAAPSSEAPSVVGEPAAGPSQPPSEPAHPAPANPAPEEHVPEEGAHMEESHSEDGSWVEAEDEEMEAQRKAKGKAPLQGPHVLEETPAV